MKIPTNWTFENADVASGFDEHVREQLPWYDLATQAVAHIARHYITDGGLVYDIGASSGNIGRALSDTLYARGAEFVPIEKSKQMVEIYKGVGEVQLCDAMEYEYKPYDVAILFLVVMFMPPGKRLTWLRELASKIKPGGALIVFDKVVFDCGYVSTIMHRLTMLGKKMQGANSDDIISKELSLCGSQRPLDGRAFEMTMPNAIKVFQFGEFVGWVIERAE